MKEKIFVKNGNKLVVSEFVSCGHPDKIADQISDAILDAFLEKDINARTGIEVMVKDNIVVLGGEVNSCVNVDYDKIVRQVYEKLDFPANHHLSPSEIKIINLIGKQSEEIHSGVDKDNEIGAGDQGFCVGYASNETPTYMPLGHYLAKTICNYVAKQTDIGFGPDVKSQVIVEYDNKGNAIGIYNILVSSMHCSPLNVLRNFVIDAIKHNNIGIDNTIYEKFIKDKDIKFDVNPCGPWMIGGPVSDCGVTGNIVASGLCNKARVTLSYMIGVAQPCSLEIDMDKNKEKVPLIKKWIADNIDLTPKAFIDWFYTNRGGQFFITSRKGHYGFNTEINENDYVNYPWERLDFAAYELSKI